MFCFICTVLFIYSGMDTGTGLGAPGGIVGGR